MEDGGEVDSSRIEYEEYSDNDNDNEEQQMFIETIRRGTLAVQQRRRRLLERPRNLNLNEARLSEQLNSTSAMVLNGYGGGNNDDDDDDDDDDNHRPLHSTSLLAVQLGQIQRRQQHSDHPNLESGATGHRDDKVYMLYCSSSTSSSSLPRDFYYLASKQDNADEEENSARGRSGGGCGQLICARGLTTSVQNTYESDAPPSTLAVDWLDILLPSQTARQDEQKQGKWQNLCDCIQATLGCRRCGNAVGVSTLFQCGPCRRKQHMSSLSIASNKWTFWTSQAVPRTREGLSFMTRDVSLSPAEDNNPSLHWTSSTLPTAIQDFIDGLAGQESEWQDTAETLFKCSPLPALNREIKGFRRGQRAGSEAGGSMTDNPAAESRRSGLLSRARAIRRDLRAFIDQTGLDGGLEDTAEGVPGRRRRGVSTGEQAEEGTSEREFRRRRTAEILESTSGRGSSLHVQEVDVAVPLSLPFDTAREPVGR